MKLELEDTKTEVLGSQVLFPVAKNDSFLLDFVKENSIKKSAGLREENIIAIKNFLSELFDSASHLLSEQKAFVNSGDIALNPGPAENPILLAYGRRFMCLSSTYFF